MFYNKIVTEMLTSDVLFSSESVIWLHVISSSASMEKMTVLIIIFDHVSVFVRTVKWLFI